MQGQRPLDWISRIVMLVLAGMVTLSVVGVIEAIPRGAMQDRIAIDRPRQQQLPQQEPVRPEQQPQQPQPAPTEARQPQNSAASGGLYGPAALVPAPPEDNDVERWLEAITYALMALVGLLAIATLVLWRSLRERRRIADALEALSLAPRT
jgi:hypothetical protein